MRVKLCNWYMDLGIASTIGNASLLSREQKSVSKAMNKIYFKHNNFKLKWRFLMA